MPGSTFGGLFRVSTWGESHGKGVGVVIDGCPPGIPLDESLIQPMMLLLKIFLHMPFINGRHPILQIIILDMYYWLAKEVL